MRNKQKFPHQINVNLTDNERQWLREKSQNGKISQSEFIRMLIRYYPKNIESMQEILKNLKFELRKIGVNINQIAHAANMGDLTKNELEELKVYCKKTCSVLEKAEDYFEKI